MSEAEETTEKESDLIHEPVNSRDYLRVMSVLSQSPHISAELLNNFSRLISNVPTKQATHRRWIPMLDRPEKQPVRISGVDFTVSKIVTRQFMQMSPRWAGYLQYVFHDWEHILGQTLDFFMLARTVFERAMWDAQNGALTYFSENVLIDFWDQLEVDPASAPVLAEIHQNYVETCLAARNEAEKNGDPLPEFLPFGVCFLLESLAEETMKAFTTWLGINTFFMSSIAENVPGNTTKAISTLAGESTRIIEKVAQSTIGKSFSKNLGFQNLVPQRANAGG